MLFQKKLPISRIWLSFFLAKLFVTGYCCCFVVITVVYWFRSHQTALALARRSIHENRTIRARVHLVTVWCRVAVVCCLSGVSIKKAPRSEALQNVGQFLHQACRRFKLLLLLTQLGQCVKGVDHVGGREREREREACKSITLSRVCWRARKLQRVTATLE